MNNAIRSELTRRFDSMAIGSRRYIYGVLVLKVSTVNWRVSGLEMSRSAAVEEVYRKGITIQREFADSLDN